MRVRPFRRLGVNDALGACVLLLILAVTHTLPATGQTTRSAGKPAAKDADDDLEKYKELLEGSALVERETQDGVYLTARYWRPREPGKDTPVIVLVHNRGKSQSQRVWYPLAKKLADEGFAVVSFDFRGHGDSRQVNPDLYKAPREVLQLERERAARYSAGARLAPPRGATGGKIAKSRKSTPRKIDQGEEFKKGAELAYFLQKDLEEIKRFLIEENNAGRLNVRRMGMVAAGLGATISVKWAEELEFQQRGGKSGWTRQGADLSAVAMLSPTLRYDNFKMPTGLASSGIGLPVFILASGEGKDADDAGRVAKLFRVEDRTEGKSEKTAKASKDAKPAGTNNPVAPAGGESAYVRLASKLSATDLVRDADSPTSEAIVKFFKTNLMGKRGFAWEKRALDIDGEEGFGSGRTQ